MAEWQMPGGLCVVICIWTVHIVTLDRGGSTAMRMPKFPRNIGTLRTVITDP
ncbi:hypothetical protein ACWEF9_36865 [Streptomyces sp. NPDC004980]